MSDADKFTFERPECPRCNSKQMHYRSRTKTWVCRICGAVIEEEKVDGFGGAA
jgi:ribosomal protein L37AE/L43A